LSDALAAIAKSEVSDPDPFWLFDCLCLNSEVRSIGAIAISRAIAVQSHQVLTCEWDGVSQEAYGGLGIDSVCVSIKLKEQIA